MNHYKKELIASARRVHKKIFPCGDRETVEDGFTIEGKFLLFWFNTEDNSTHLLSREL
jgi:hypothetical protein